MLSLKKTYKSLIQFILEIKQKLASSDLIYASKKLSVLCIEWKSSDRDISSYI